MKRIVAASLDKLVDFDTEDEFKKYIEHLDSRKREYEVLFKSELGGGRLRVRIKEQYNNNELLLESKGGRNGRRL